MQHPIRRYSCRIGQRFFQGVRNSVKPKKILTGVIKKIEIAQSGNKYFVTVVGIGIDGKIVQTVNHSRYKKWFNTFRLGRLSYVISLLHVLFRYRPLTVNIKVDEMEMRFSNVWLIAVANIPNYRGGMIICPGASYTDGVFDICIVHGISRFEVIRIFPQVIVGKHILHPGISMLQGQEVKVFSDSPMLAHGDGEVMEKRQSKFRFVKKRSMSFVKKKGGWDEKRVICILKTGDPFQK